MREMTLGQYSKESDYKVGTLRTAAASDKLPGFIRWESAPGRRGGKWRVFDADVLDAHFEPKREAMRLRKLRATTRAERLAKPKPAKPVIQAPAKPLAFDEFIERDRLAHQLADAAPVIADLGMSEAKLIRINARFLELLRSEAAMAGHTEGVHP